MFIRITGVKKQVFVSLCLYLGQIGVGFFTAWPGSITPKLKDPEQSPLAYNLTETELPLVGTVAYIGGIPGPFVSGWLSNTIGRKPCIVGAVLMTCVCAVVLALPPNLAAIYCTRVLMGFSMGILTVMSIVYIGEIASTNIRGILLVVIGICQILGTMILFVVAPFLTYAGTTFVGFSINAAVLIWSLMIPESPMFYILKGNDEKVREILSDMGRSADADNLLSVKNEYSEKSSTQDWLEIFTIKSNRKAFFIGAVLNITQNCSGFMVVLFFCANIFELAGSSVNSDISMVVIGCFQLLGSTLSSVLVERAGRRIMFLISAFLCSLSMFFLGLYFYMNSVDGALLINLKWFPLLSLIVYFISYNFGVGIVPHVVLGEMFTPNVRSKGSTLALTVSWLCGFIMTTACGILLEITGGHVTFWLFAFVNACAFLFAIFFLVETKGKTLLEIQEIFSK